MVEHDKSLFVAGQKQTAKAVRSGQAAEVFLAQDAAPRVVEGIRVLCEREGIALSTVATMKELGKRCGIDTGAAAAARLKAQPDKA